MAFSQLKTLTGVLDQASQLYSGLAAHCPSSFIFYHCPDKSTHPISWIILTNYTLGKSTDFSPRGQPSGSPSNRRGRISRGRESKGWGYIQATVLRLDGKDYRPGQRVTQGSCTFPTWLHQHASLHTWHHHAVTSTFKGAWPGPQLLSSPPSCNQTSQAQLQSSHWTWLWQELQGPDRYRDLNFLFPLHKEIVARINSVGWISPETITRMGNPGRRKRHSQ